ncbi:hypothetical protein KZI27_10625 [Curtobacterium sp. TC1]|uniref:hypothetical protein n=1 Tax=Curtobacterium sp. TC1 TaxID=2862880 RepID=UPI001C9A35F1|nr:hypothetical protein [Curtobacterium sp. TC1]QZQ53822.1 hypothetical protein KZI27_10625 [Curtobacterium sp. TC1]
MTDHQRTTAATNRDRYRLVSRYGFVAAPAMFFLPLIYLMVTGEYQPWVVICMTAAFAVLISASSFAAMANTPPGSSPGTHQLWAVPVAIFALLPGAVLSFGLRAMITSLLSQAHAASTRDRASNISPSSLKEGPDRA